ncbi:hypothetical protein ML5_0865 [Micromonospora sp. L5]|uniref:hypothetical protein n=1 Tax=Micromonospora sp. (strain L5) TaxID=648999 RepID=UPI0001C45C91|nr:hypothetical protein [Micromonospora sp. L5]ADU06407.1 hypothetical protein ML5_0865 [Micromonospora sp. L5]
MSYGQTYRIVSVVAADSSRVVLYLMEVDHLRAELIGLHLLIEDSASSYDRRAEDYRTQTMRHILLPLPLSWYKSGLDVGELVQRLSDTFWEVRLPDTPAILARIADLYPCEPGCRWVTTEDAEDSSAIDFTLEHGAGCDLAEAGPAEIEAAP